MSRADEISAFLGQAGWADATVTGLAGDASNRRYDRLTKPDGTTAVLMDASLQSSSSVRSFVKIARYLNGIGLSAPDVLHQHVEAGLLLIEDLGDRLFTLVMASDPSLELPLYFAAADVLIHLHQRPVPDLPAYDSATTVPLAALSYDWYQLGAKDSTDVSARNRLADHLFTLLSPYDREMDVLIQRDYHAENLVWLPHRSGVARVGLLDFQDAMLGHPAYDLVSVLQDARRDVSTPMAEEIKDHFVDQSGYDPDLFDSAYAAFGLQRNLRILGVFSRLCMRDGKSQYIDLIPRVWGHIQTNLKHPSLTKLAPMISEDLPSPSYETLSRLKAKSGQWAGR